MRCETVSSWFQLLLCFCSNPFCYCCGCFVAICKHEQWANWFQKRNGFERSKKVQNKLNSKFYRSYSYSKLFLYTSQLNGQTNQVPLLENKCNGFTIFRSKLVLNHGKSKVLPKMPPGNMAVFVFRGHENHFLSLKKNPFSAGKKSLSRETWFPHLLGDH